MRKIQLMLALVTMLLCTFFAKAQLGTISTFSTVGACNIALDRAGKLYTGNTDHVYRIDSGSSETSVVGGGTSYGDGGPATAALLNFVDNVAFDNSDNMYIADNGYGVIRKVNTSGIISTIAGNHISGPGYTGDGGAATAAQIDCSTVCVDNAGNVYIADQTHYVIRKVNASGIITTIAGNGTNGYSGDGGPATAAALENYTECDLWGITTDVLGNLYISTGHGYRVRKVTPAGVITTVAGNGSAGSGGVGGPAIAANVYYPEGLTTDAAGNLFISEWQNCVLAVMNTAGTLNTVAGNYTISFSGDGGPATAAGLNAVSDVAIDANGNIYIADCHNGRIRKVTGSYLSATHVADSFGVNINEMCSGAQLNIMTHTYNSAYSVKCYYGDGTIESSPLTSSYFGGFVALTHAYLNPGTYTIKTVLINGTTPFDSLSYTYEYKLCNTLSTQYYYDANNDNAFDAGDSRLSLPVLTEIDSNGVAVDTISSTSGIYYTAYGRPGDVYKFKVISSPGALHPTYPTTGIVTDTLQSTTYNTNLSSVAFQCSTLTNYDFAVNAIVPVTGVHDQWGDIYVSNSHCAPEAATVTLHYSKHYMADMGGGGLDVHPTPASYTDSTITWNVSSLSASESAPVDLYYAIWTNPDSGMVVGYPAHSYYTVYPIASDVDTSNNIQIIVDTVRGGCDPNEMTVTPSGYISAGTQLKYTINFTNTGNDTTYNVYVMDTLSDNVDISSFRLVMSSANMNIAKIKSGGHNILKFDFPNINLLDSLHYPQNCSKGLTFTINTKSGLPNGTTIFNHAGVFFDYNPVVLTNTVEDIIGIPATSLSVAATKVSSLMIYPNPASSSLHIDNLQSATTYTLSDIVGGVIQQGELVQGNNTIDIRELPKGVYFVHIDGDEVRKLIKL